MKKQTIDMGPGYRVTVLWDACGCTLTFLFQKFDGLNLTIDERGNFTAHYVPDVGPVDEYRSHAPNPGGIDRTELGYNCAELHHIPAEELEGWLEERLTEHHSRTFPPIIGSTTPDPGLGEAVGIDMANIMDGLNGDGFNQHDESVVGARIEVGGTVILLM